MANCENGGEMQRVISLLALKPILYGLIGMVISGISFPVAGVIVVQNGLISMRYMLMHGVILGGVAAVVLDIPMLVAVIPLNVILVLIMVRLNKEGCTLSVASTAMMVCTMGLASLVSHVFDVPAKDTLEVLWGSPFALTRIDLILLIILGVLTISYVSIFFRPISMLFFDKDIASSMRVPVRVHNTVMVLTVALIVSVAMRVLGALLIDALLVLPVVGTSKRAKSLKQLFIQSSVTGLVLSLVGYLLALLWNLPVSGTLALLAVLVFVLNSLFSGFCKKHFNFFLEKGRRK